MYFCTTIIFTIFLVLYNPDESKDLYRYYKMLENYHANGIKFAFSQYYFKFAPLYPIFFYCISRFGIPKLLVFATSIISYGTTFYLFFRVCKRYNLSKTAVFLGYLSVILFIDLVEVTGVRQNIGSVWAMIGCYQLMNKNSKFMGWFFLIIASLMHHVLWVVLVVALILSLFKSNIAVRVTCCLIPLFIMCVLLGIIPLGTWCLKLYTKTDYGFFYALGHQIILYTARVDNNSKTNIMYMFSSIIRVLLLRHDNRNTSEKDSMYSLIPVMVMMIGIGLLRIPTACIRFFTVANVISLPLLWKYFNKWVFSQDITEEDKFVVRSSNSKNNFVAVGIAVTLLIQFVYIFYGQYIKLGSIFLNI